MKNPIRRGRSAVALIVAASLAGCTDDRADAAARERAAPPRVDDSRRVEQELPRPEPKPSPGMSTNKKVILLAGAASLYYLYKHHQTGTKDGSPAGQEQYYLSKNGRVYYRDAQHRAHWVTPPPEGIMVSEAEAREYKQFQGYDNRADGRDLRGLGGDPHPFPTER